ncbi:MAG: hypothetical protein E7238_07420 [Sarcina sp.]|nr:hypothetical protein [Sarcina sp.]
MRHKISVVVLMLCVMTSVTGCMNREQKKTLEELTQYMESSGEEKGSVLREQLEAHDRMDKWSDNKDFQAAVYNLVEQNFTLQEDDNKCAIMLDELAYQDYRSYTLRDEYQVLLGKKASDLESKLAIYEIANDSGWYGKDFKIELKPGEVLKYDTSSFTVEEVMDLNSRIRRVNNRLEKKIQQSNIDLSLKGKDFISKMDLWKEMLQHGYDKPVFITKEDIDVFTSSHSEPIYTENGKGGYYDDRSHRTLKYEKDKITTYKGEAGFLTINSIEYFGDFAMRAGEHTYVDSSDYYKYKTNPYFACKFKDSYLDTNLEEFMRYKEFVYSPPYLFMATENTVDVFDMNEGFGEGKNVLSLNLK